MRSIRNNGKKNSAPCKKPSHLVYDGRYIFQHAAVAIATKNVMEDAFSGTHGVGYSASVGSGGFVAAPETGLAHAIQCH